MPKSFKLRPDQIRVLAPGHGAAFASDHITVGGLPVQVMYREPPDGPQDSGWRFLSGHETDEDLDDPGKLGIYDVNTIANYDPRVVPFLDLPCGSAVEHEDGQLVVAQRGADCPPGLDPRFPVVRGAHRLPNGWTVGTGSAMSVRIEEGQHVCWRPGLTIWTLASLGPESADARMSAFRGRMDGNAYDVVDEQIGSLRRVAYRLSERAEDGRVDALYGFVATDRGEVFVSAYFDDEGSLGEALAFWRSVEDGQ